jgi:hypothetical protein
MLSSHALTPNEEKRPGLVCRFLKGVRCKPGTHRLRKSGGGRVCSAIFKRDPILGNETRNLADGTLCGKGDPYPADGTRRRWWFYELHWRAAILSGLS